MITVVDVLQQVTRLVFLVALVTIRVDFSRRDPGMMRPSVARMLLAWRCYTDTMILFVSALAIADVDRTLDIFQEFNLYSWIHAWIWLFYLFAAFSAWGVILTHRDLD